jgi:hypothetical protein
MESKPVFNAAVMDAFNGATKVLFNRVISYNQPPFTQEDILTLLVPESDRDVLRRAPIVGADNYMTNTCGPQWRTIYLEIELRHLPNTARPLAPRSPILQEDAPQELINRMDEWVHRRRAIGLEFARVDQVVKHLNGVCKLPSQVRYAWPSIVALASMNEFTQQIGRNLTTFKRPRSLPPIHDIRESLQKASATVSSALLLADDRDYTSEVTIKPFGGGHHQEPPLSFMPW